MTRIRQLVLSHRQTLLKTLSYSGMHMLVAATVAYLVTGDIKAAIALSLLEPAVQTLAYVFHERAWERVLRRRQSQAGQAAANAPEQLAGSAA
ncbi:MULTISPECIES: DUF2061 domain-containing protein [Brachymonas]|uniref:DUF2061 domain-containing protein n=1 Tax=Brachymonas TaxID=28219 RepID=UPI002E776935|nr:DUF2061 domain-containing protein [Brachymonas sp. J145]MEE1652492.1 DUF2061 domain-containing protein [Brachymonas sp. J145]